MPNVADILAKMRTENWPLNTVTWRSQEIPRESGEEESLIITSSKRTESEERRKKKKATLFKSNAYKGKQRNSTLLGEL